MPSLNIQEILRAVCEPQSFRGICGAYAACRFGTDGFPGDPVGASAVGHCARRLFRWAR